MRVLLAHRFLPGHFGPLAAALAAAGDAVVFLHAEGEAALPGVRTVRIAPGRAPAPTTHHYLQPLERAVLLGQAAWRAAAELAREGFRPELVHAHLGFGMALYLKDAWPDAPLVGLAEWWYRARGADADHLDPAALGPDDRLRIRTLNAGLLLELAACDHVLVPTRFQQSIFPEPWRDRLEPAPDGVEVARFAPAAGPVAPPPGLPALPAAAEIVSYATRGLEPYRGFPQFLAAVARLQAARPRLHAVVVGEDRAFYGPPPPGGGGWKAATLAALPELDPTRVHFLPFLTGEAWPDLLRWTRVHVYLTVPFVLSWSLLEAMAAGCALVASDTAPVREVIEDGKEGLLVEMREPAAIAAGIARLLDDPALRARLGAAARRRVLARHDRAVLLGRRIARLRRLARAR